MKCARPRKRNAEGGFLEDPTGGHMNTPHTSQDTDVEGQDEDGELSQGEGREIEAKEGLVLLVTNAPPPRHSWTESGPMTLKSQLLQEPHRISRHRRRHEGQLGAEGREWRPRHRKEGAPRKPWGVAHSSPRKEPVA